MCRVLRAYVEMTTRPGEASMTCSRRARTSALALTHDRLIELRAAVEAMVEPALAVYDDFIACPL